MSLAKPTIGFGIALSVIGVVGYLLANVDPETGRSVTALIPAFIGIILIICGILALKAAIRKHVMHVAVLVGLLGFFGSASRVPKTLAAVNEGGEGMSIALISQSLTALLLLAFVILCVNSFIQARRNRKA